MQVRGYNMEEGLVLIPGQGHSGVKKNELCVFVGCWSKLCIGYTQLRLYLQSNFRLALGFVQSLVSKMLPSSFVKGTEDQSQ